MKTKTLYTDIVIIGGGIAGLWALTRLRQLGYSAILLEANTLGGGQTIHAQGIIHGGIKYALTGFLTNSADAIAAMPNRWKACLTGKGDIDLTSVTVLSHEQLLWSTGGLASDITGFFASKALKSRVQTLSRNHYPTILQNAAFKGHVYRLEEVVLDMPSLIRTLVSFNEGFIFKIDNVDALKILPNSSHIEFYNNHKTATIEAKKFIFTAGEGNEALSKAFKDAPSMQRRPLQMVFVKFKKDMPFYAHCIDKAMNPRITITTHKTLEGQTVWYLGGQLAEEGIHRTQEEQIACAKKELNTLFPWFDLNNATWTSFFINRSEQKQPNGKRPDYAFLKNFGNTLIAWPTKLALAPALVDDILIVLQEENIEPSKTNLQQIFSDEFKHWENPKIALPIWDRTIS